MRVTRLMQKARLIYLTGEKENESRSKVLGI